MAVLDDRKYADYTEYPNIFQIPYWGNHRLAQREGIWNTDITAICNNRNKFIKDYDIEKYHKPSLKMMDKSRVLKKIYEGQVSIDIRDHIEFYICRDKTLISVFSKCVDIDEHNLIISQGYKLIPPLYFKEQNTYMKVILK